MFSIQYFLLLILIYEPIINTNQNDFFLLSSNSQQRIKRFLSRKSSKTKLQSSNNQNGKSSQKPSNKGYTQQELSEIKRILTKKEDDYYGILDINKQATQEKIIIAYKKLISRVHPDKFNAPGATEATQRLNKARVELLKKFQQLNSNYQQQTTEILTTQNIHREIIEKTNLFSTFSSLSSESKDELFYEKFKYILLISGIFIIGIIIFIIFWIKQQRRLSSSINRHYSKKFYETPDSNDEGKTKNRNSEISILQDEE